MAPVKNVMPGSQTSEFERLMPAREMNDRNMAGAGAAEMCALSAMKDDRTNNAQRVRAAGNWSAAGMSDQRKADLALAAWHVAQGRMIVARQRERIAYLRTLGYSTLDAEQTFRVFASTLEIFVDHERWLWEGTFLRSRKGQGGPETELRLEPPLVAHRVGASADTRPDL